MKLMAHHRQSFRCHAGFTLLELLVALAIFALLSVMAYAGLSTVLNANQILDTNMQRLSEVQRSVTLLSRDIRQTINRAIRDTYGDTKQPLIGATAFDTLGTPVVELTRTGYANPLGTKRSFLQRVAYRVEEETLYRDSWRVLDQAQDSEADALAICHDVESLALRYLDQEDAWHEQWPPSDPEFQGAVLPKAVEVSLELTDWGKIVRLLPLAGTG
ncbi:MAG: type II secretion system minor pseudopilin GspJ [Halobacteria archaeon]|nr:type II secretion system minor pseudopilin GspJ [Halobacteria archaeon]